MSVLWLFAFPSFSFFLLNSLHSVGMGGWADGWSVWAVDIVHAWYGHSVAFFVFVAWWSLYLLICIGVLYSLFFYFGRTSFTIVLTSWLCPNLFVCHEGTVPKR